MDGITNSELMSQSYHSIFDQIYDKNHIVIQLYSMTIVENNGRHIWYNVCFKCADEMIANETAKVYSNLATEPNKTYININSKYSFHDVLERNKLTSFLTLDTIDRTDLFCKNCKHFILKIFDEKTCKFCNSFIQIV